jgi:hypothetical protein
MTINVPTGPVQSLPTAEIFTGNPATVNDAYDTTKLNNGARIAPGTAVYIIDPATTSTGGIQKWRYVRVNSTVPGTYVVGPVYWKDNTYQVCTQKDTEALMGLNGLAGLLTNVNFTNGNFTFILVAGHYSAVPAPGSTAAGDAIIGATGTQLTARVAQNTAPTNTVLALAETAVSGGKSDMRIVVEDLGF